MGLPLRATLGLVEKVMEPEEENDDLFVDSREEEEVEEEYRMMKGGE